ncbi:MAG: DUF2157 domain-containing protein [Cyclobacteriaceae bacterium]|nr:DUF2157 domain-containing protein [Cyclobacteriaceae bacterium]
MHIEQLNELRKQNLITEEHYARLEPIVTRKIVSVWYELRVLLYLGVLLFTTGIGILIYQNIGNLGHLLSIIALFLLTAVCFWYAITNATLYTSDKVKAPTPYFDYVVLLGCLLFISVLTYLQFQYSLFDEGMGATTLFTAAVFFYAAYRFDHIGVLSLAITAFASFWGISISTQKWYSGDFFETANLHHTAILVATALAIAALVLDRKGIKKHFTFSYLNYAFLLFFIGALAGVFMNNNSYGWYVLVVYAGCALAVYTANQQKSFLFLIYAFIAGYIATTFFLADFILHDPFTWFMYLITSCGGFIYFIVRYKNYFKREA